MIWSDLRQLFRETLQKNYPLEEIDALFYLLIENRHGMKRIDFELKRKQEVAEIELLKSDLERLLAGEPVQYITERAPFFGMDLAVSSAVLIPRPETEELVQLVLQTNQAPTCTLLDIGTGSGCIPIAIARSRPAWLISGLDVSNEALKIARKNAEEQNVAVTWLQQNIIELPEIGTFDIIVSNPPYIPFDQATSLEPHVLNHEPHLALFAPEHDALFFYRVIKQFAAKGLTKPGGRIYFETHFDLAQDVAGLFNDAKQVAVHADMFGKQRFVEITY